MNVEHLRSVLDSVTADNRKQGIADLLSRLGDEYTQTFQNPTPETAASYEAVEEELKAAIESGQCILLPPSGIAILERLDAVNLCGSGLLKKVRAIVGSAETPAAKVSQLQQLHQRVDKFTQTATAMRDAMQEVNIQAKPIPDDAAEVEVRLPSGFIDDSLGGLAKETGRLNRALLDIVECVSGGRPALKIRSLSSGSIEIFLTIDPVSGAAIATLIAALLGLIDRILQFMTNRLSYQEKGAPEDVLERLAALEQAERDEDLKKLSEALLAKIGNEARRNELRDAVTGSVHYLADRLDKGMEVTVAILPSAVPEEEPPVNGDEISAERAKWLIAQSMKEVRRIERQSEPVLALPPSSEGEGEDETTSPAEQAAKDRE